MFIAEKYKELQQQTTLKKRVISIILAALIALVCIVYVYPLYRFSIPVGLLLFIFPFAVNLIILLRHKMIRSSAYWFFKLITAVGYLFYVIIGMDLCCGDFAYKGTVGVLITPDPLRLLIGWPVLWLIPVLIVLISTAIMKRSGEEGKFRKTISDWILFYSPYIPGVSRRSETAEKKQFSALIPTVLILATGIFFAATLYLRTYFPDMDVEAILFNVKFANGAFNRHILVVISIYAACVLAVSVLFFIMMKRRTKIGTIECLSPDKNESRMLSIKDMSKKGIYAVPIAAAVISFICLAWQVDLVGYADSIINETSLYMEYYVEPVSSVYSFPEHKKNLIYIYLESYENTFTSYENGGNQPVDYMPEMVELANSHVNFSNTDGLGGQSVFFSTVDYTMGSTVAQTSGIPLMLYNSESESDAEYTTMRRLEDILHDEGYNQIFIRGEDTSFARYEEYVGRYENSTIFDHKEALKQGWIPEGYEETWGYEDQKLFEFSKILIKDIAEKGAPFCATLYTVDTHGLEGGYRCPLCDPGITDDFAAAVRCTSRKIDDFLTWLEQQDFYEDTVVIMVGDHPVEGRKNNKVVNLDENDYCRTTYNCIINSDTQPVKEKNRLFTAMDMFPTTLSALGVRIEGNRLGLGTDLFSEEQTLCELLGKETFLKEIKRHSKYYKTRVYE